MYWRENFSIKEINWAASSEFGTYRLCEQRRFRRACASSQSRQNLRCSLIQAVSREEPSDRKPDPWPLWMAGHAHLKFVMTECSKTQIRLTRPSFSCSFLGCLASNDSDILFTKSLSCELSSKAAIASVRFLMAHDASWFFLWFLLFRYLWRQPETAIEKKRVEKGREGNSWETCY